MNHAIMPLERPFIIIGKDDYIKLMQKAEELEEIKSYLISLCQQTCKGREGYTGKLRHVPDCPAYNLGMVE